MPNYTFIREKDGAKFTIAGDKPPSQEIVEHFSKQIPLKTEQVQETQIQESVKEPVQEDKKFSFKGFAEQIQKPPQKGETLKTLLNLASFAPTPAGLAAKAAAIGSKVPIISKATGYLAKKAAEIVPQAYLASKATYINERQKGAYEDEAKRAEEKGLFNEILLGAAIEAAAYSTKGLGKFIIKNIPDDLYQKAKKYSKDTAVSVENRIEQITNLGKKALKNNEIIAKKVNEKALKASTENKNSAKKIANNMTKLAKDFFEKQKLDNRAKMISKIPDLKLENAINQEHQRLIRNAQTITEDGRVLPRKEEKAVLKDFEDLFILKPKPTVLLDQFGKPITVTKGKAPIQNKKIFLDNLDKLQDKTAYGAGEKELKQQYSNCLLYTSPSPRDS